MVWLEEEENLSSSAQQREHVARSFDHLLLLRRRVNEFDAVCESGAVPDDSPHHKLGRVIRKQEFKAETAAWFDFARDEQAQSTSAHVAHLPAEAGALAVQNRSDVHIDRHVVALPAALFFPFRHCPNLPGPLCLQESGLPRDTFSHFHGMVNHFRRIDDVLPYLMGYDLSSECQ